MCLRPQLTAKVPLHYKRGRKTVGVARTCVATSDAVPGPLGETSVSTNPLVEGMNRRLEADKDFLFKLFVECGVDQCITLIANASAFGLNPLAWSATAIASATLLHFTAIFNDLVLVWCLAPVAGSTKEEKPKISHVFQEMDGVTMKDRVMCWVDKFKLYGVVGMCTAFVGGLLTLAITGKALELNRLIRTAGLGFVHMGISSNTRYQTVNGVELLFSKILPPSLARVGTICVRTCNNFLGARIFLLLAVLFRF